VSTVLILMSNTGGGHRSVAQALAGALKHLNGNDVDVVIADPFAIGRRNVVDRLTYLYSPLIVHYPWLWGVVYHLTDHKPIFRSLVRLGDRMMAFKMSHLFASVQPGVVVSVHPLCNHLASLTIQRLGWSVPIMTVLTDLVSIHTGWIVTDLDLYSVPTAEAARALSERGISSAKLRVFGLPIDQRFGCLHASKEQSRRSLGLEENHFTVLVVGGSEGAGNLFANVKALAEAQTELQVMVVCGHNERLKSKLKWSLPNLPGQVYGFVHNMPELMNAADVVVTKAGSVTIAEALAMQRPIVLTDVLPGQEEGNVAFVERNGVGMRAKSPGDLVEKVTLLAKNPAWHECLSSNTQKIGKPEAAVDTAKAVIALMPGGGHLEALGRTTRQPSSISPQPSAG